MQRFGPISRGIAIATLLCFAAPQAEAIEVYGAGAAATGLDNGLSFRFAGDAAAAVIATAAAACTAAVAECIAAAACIME